jgi:hypothetical protein
MLCLLANNTSPHAGRRIRVHAPPPAGRPFRQAPIMRGTHAPGPDSSRALPAPGLEQVDTTTHTRARTPYTQHPAPSSLSPVRSAPHSCAAQELQSPHDGGTSQRQQRLIGPSSDGRTGGQAAHQWVRHSVRGSPLLSHPMPALLPPPPPFSFGPCFSPAISRFLLGRACRHSLGAGHCLPLAWFGSWALGTASSSVSAKAVSFPPVSLSLCHFQLAKRARFTPYHPSPTVIFGPFFRAFSRRFSCIFFSRRVRCLLLCSKARGGGTNLGSQIPMASCA